jgi:hypothetical protein
MDNNRGYFNREYSLKMWMFESPTYNFSISLSTSLVQPLGIRILGMDIALLGVLTAVQLSFVGFGAIIGTSIILRYRYFRKKLWLFFGAINRIGWASIIFADLVPSYSAKLLTFYSAVAVSQMSGAIAGIAAGDVGADIVTRDRAPKFFGRLNSLNNMASLISLAASIVVFLYLGGGSRDAYWVLYILSLVAAIISTIFLRMIRDDPGVVMALKPVGSAGLMNLVSIYRDMTRSRGVKEYILIILLYTVAVNFPASIWNYYLIYSIGGDEVWITSKMATVYLVKALILGIWPFIVDRYGTRIIFTTTLVMISPIPILFMVARSLASQILLEIYSSVWWSSWDLLTGLYNLYLFPRDVRPIALSIIVFSTNMGASSASIIGSIISSSIPYGSEITFTLSALSRVLVSLLAFKKLPLLDLKIKQ